MSFLDIVKIVIIVLGLTVALVLTIKEDLKDHDMDIFKLIEEDKDIDDDN